MGSVGSLEKKNMKKFLKFWYKNNAIYLKQNLLYICINYILYMHLMLMVSKNSSPRRIL